MAGQGPATKRRLVVVEPQDHRLEHNSSSSSASRRAPVANATASATSTMRPSIGARLTHDDLKHASPPQAPPADTPLSPLIHKAIRNPTKQQARLVLPSECQEGGEDVLPIFVMRKQHDNTSAATTTTTDVTNGNTTTTGTTTTTTERAYAILPTKRPIVLRHGDPNFPRPWGRLLYGIAYHRVYTNNDDTSNNKHGGCKTFQVPSEQTMANATPDDPVHVAIKVIDKAAIAHALGGADCVLREDAIGENPYKEICRLQQMGDNVHVLKCLDALEDDDYLYIITPKAAGGSLVDTIWNPNGTQAQPPLTPDRIGQYFTKILHILAYLERYSIHHRDLSPDNLLFLDGDKKQLVAMDFAMSVKIPQVNVSSSNNIKNNNLTQHQQRTLISDIGNFGTVRWMAPEIYCGFPFDGVAADLWSALVILYNLQTQHVLYHAPHPADISFRYFVFAGGLTQDSINERMHEIMMDVFYFNNNPNNNNDDDEDRDDGETPEQRRKRQLDQQTLLRQSAAHLEFSPAMKDLFAHFFRALPMERWTLAQVMESAYVVQQQQEQSQDYHREHG